MRLVAIGLVAGLFSALFGVGGGIVIVPLLLLAGSWTERPAMATSLAAIGLIAFVGTVSYAAAIVGLPAALGAIAGTALQQRLAGRTLSLAFAALLAGIGIKLLL